MNRFWNYRITEVVWGLSQPPHSAPSCINTFICFSHKTALYHTGYTSYPTHTHALNPVHNDVQTRTHTHLTAVQGEHTYTYTTHTQASLFFFSRFSMFENTSVHTANAGSLTQNVSLLHTNVQFRPINPQKKKKSETKKIDDSNPLTGLSHLHQILLAWIWIYPPSPISLRLTKGHAQVLAYIGRCSK